MVSNKTIGTLEQKKKQKKTTVEPRWAKQQTRKPISRVHYICISEGIEDDEISRLRRELEKITREEQRLKRKKTDELRRKLNEKQEIISKLRGMYMYAFSLYLFSDLCGLLVPCEPHILYTYIYILMYCMYILIQSTLKFVRSLSLRDCFKHSNLRIFTDSKPCNNF